VYEIKEVTAAYNKRNKTNYTPKELLDELYNRRLLSAATIGRNYLFVSGFVVFRFLEEVGIKCRVKGRPEGRTGYLKKLFNIPAMDLKRMRPYEIRAVVGCSGGYLRQMLVKYGIEYNRGRGAVKKQPPANRPAIRGRGIGELVDARI